jgi:hypothetical protein
MPDLPQPSLPLIVVADGRNLSENVKQVLHLYLHLFVHQTAR